MTWQLAPALAMLVLRGGCAARGPARPVGAAADDLSAAAALEALTGHCRPLRTATAEIRLSGRAGRERVRARLLSGFAEPAAVRLEALAPFGGPALVLASDGGPATLLFPRERQVLRGAPVASVLDALTGLALDGADLRRMLFGCLAGPAGRGQRYGDAWQTVDDGEARVYLHRGVLVAADYRGWQVEYGDVQGGIARRVRVQRPIAAGAIDLVAVLAEVSLNVELDARAFLVDVPADAVAMTLDDLRRSSPLAPR
jgi:hypothetical protein